MSCGLGNLIECLSGNAHFAIRQISAFFALREWVDITDQAVYHLQLLWNVWIVRLKDPQGMTQKKRSRSGMTRQNSIMDLNGGPQLGGVRCQT